MGLIHRWLEPLSGKHRILTRAPWHHRIARKDTCCCPTYGDCCGRNMPGTTAPMYPDTLNYCIHGVVFNVDPGSMCSDCWTGDECGAAVWDEVEGSWIDDITMSGCNYNGTLRITCQNRIAGAGSCGDENWGSDWIGSINDISPCVSPTTGTDDHVFELHATLSEINECYCNPLVLESDNITMAGICCLGCFPGSAQIQVSVWE